MQAPAPDIGPRGAGRQLDLAFNLYFRNLRALIGAALVVVVPLTAITFGLDLIAFAEPTVPDGYFTIGDTNRPVDVGTFNRVMVAETVLGILAYLLIVGTAYRAASDAYLGREPSIGESIRTGIRRAHSILWVSILTMVVVLFGLALLIIPGIYLTIALAVAIPALMVEGRKGWKAVNRSFNLVQGNWWRAFAVIVVATIFAGLFELIGGLAGVAAEPLADDRITLWILIQDLVAGLVVAITAPLLAVAALVVYFDLRIRKEGYDIELLADRLGTEPDALPAAGVAPTGAPAVPAAPPPSGSQPPPSGSQPPPPDPSTRADPPGRIDR